MVHPRECGGYLKVFDDMIKGEGSSPLTRGIREEKTQKVKDASVHPRTCGGYSASQVPMVATGG